MSVSLVNSRILSEITAFKKNKIIENVFIKVDESNIRKIDVLIVGSKGTPYECGFFHFEFTYPNMYPNVPMHVLFKTTSNGSFRFNPNLYANGKVCLSVINTWGSNDWTPANNLTSVILSIQALVMHDKPITNEPGYEKASKKDIDNYNNTIIYHTMSIALLENLKNSSNDLPNRFVFADEIIEIFKKDGFAERALEICELNKDSVFLGNMFSRTPINFNYNPIKNAINDYISLYKKSSSTNKDKDEVISSVVEVVVPAVVPAEVIETCMICLKPCTELGEFNGTRECQNCTFIACNNCLDKWYTTSMKTNCPQCKLVFAVEDNVPAKIVKPAKPKKVLTEEQIAAKATAKLLKGAEKQAKYEEQKAKEFFSQYVLYKPNTEYTWSNLKEKLKDAPIEDITYYYISLSVNIKSMYFIFNELGHWIMLDSPKGRFILTEHKQKIICLTEGDKKDKVFNKDTQRWVAKDKKSGIDYIKKASQAVEVEVTVVE